MILPPELLKGQAGCAGISRRRGWLMINNMLLGIHGFRTPQGGVMECSRLLTHVNDAITTHYDHSMMCNDAVTAP